MNLVLNAQTNLKRAMKLSASQQQRHFWRAENEVALWGMEERAHDFCVCFIFWASAICHSRNKVILRKLLKFVTRYIYSGERLFSVKSGDNRRRNGSFHIPAIISSVCFEAVLVGLWNWNTIAKCMAPSFSSVI